MIPTLSQVCSLDAPLEKVIEDYAAGKCQSLEVWLTSLENWLKTNSPGEFHGLLARQEMTCPVASFQGGLLSSQGDARGEAWKLFRQRLELCREAGIATLVVACDVAAPLDGMVLDRVRTSLALAAQEAGKLGRRLALEFQSRSVLGNNLQTAAALVAEVANPVMGICFDAFHYYCGPSKAEDLELLTAENLFHVQVCDVADRPRELAIDGDRILPGEGDMNLAPLYERLRAIGYDKAVSIELLNPNFWRIPPLSFGEIAMTSLRRALNLAAK